MALGLSMAAVGHTVTLIDADLRRPSAHNELGEGFGEGLANLTARPSWRVESKRWGLPEVQRVSHRGHMSAGTHVQAHTIGA